VTRALFFDVDGVVVHGFHSRPKHARRWDQFLADDLGIDPDVFQEKFIKPIYIPYVLTRQKSLVNALEEVLPELGYTGSPMNIIGYWMGRDTQLNLPLMEIIKKLRATGKVRTYIATNQEDVRAYHLWCNLGLQHLFDDIFYAARLGAAKPDPKFFAAIEARLGPQDEKPLMFDDYTSVVEAADAVGWEGVLFDTAADCRRHPWIAALLSAPKDAFIAR
jgi:putative hydrolase of the HAD superfamily